MLQGDKIASSGLAPGARTLAIGELRVLQSPDHERVAQDELRRETAVSRPPRAGPRKGGSVPLAGRACTGSALKNASPGCSRVRSRSTTRPNSCRARGASAAAPAYKRESHPLQPRLRLEELCPGAIRVWAQRIVHRQVAAVLRLGHERRFGLVVRSAQRLQRRRVRPHAWQQAQLPPPAYAPALCRHCCALSQAPIFFCSCFLSYASRPRSRYAVPGTGS